MHHAAYTPVQCVQLYKLGPELYIADWLSVLNHVENQDQEISGMNVSGHTINTAVDVPRCTSIEDIKAATKEDLQLQLFKRYKIKGWSHTKEALEPEEENIGQ